MKLFNKKTSNRGFTIIEMIVVIAVLAILVLLGAPRLLGYTQKAELTRIQHDTKVMENEMGVLMLENEVDIGGWENNNKDFNQLIAEDKLFEKEGVAEKVYARHLTRDGVLNLSKYFREITSSNKIASLSDDELGIGGESYPIDELPEDFSVDKTYKVIPKEYSDKIRTRLKGTFYVNSDGKVYYEHGKPIPGEDKDKSLTCPTALPDYEFEHVTGTIVKWHGTEQYLTIPSHFLVDGKCWPVRIIGVGAFMRGNFRRVVIPDTVVRIEKDAFKDAIIDEIVIPHSVQHIADGAFSGGGINKVEVIGEPGRFAPGVFVDTEPTFRRPTPQDLGIVIHPESGTIVSSTRTFSPNRNNSNNSQSVESGNTGAVGGSLIIPEQVQVPGRTEPVRIEKIHKGAFQGEGLIEVHMPYTLKRIEAYAFAGNQLDWVEIPTSVEYIGEYAFAFNQHIHSESKKVRPTIKSIKIKDIERIHNVKLGDIVDGSGKLVNPLDGVEMKEYIWVTDADNFQFENIDGPGAPSNPTGPSEPSQPETPTDIIEAGDNIVVGNGELGFYGEVSSNSFVSMADVISESGITLGNQVNLNSDWIKVSHEGKTLYIAKNHILEDVSWNHLNSKKVMGSESPELIVDGHVYKVRTFTDDEFRDIMLSLVNGTLADYRREEIGFGNDERNWTSTMTSGFRQYINWGISEENNIQGASVPGDRLRSWRPMLEYVGPEEPSEPGHSDIGDAIPVSSMSVLEQIGKNENYPLDGNYALTSDVDLSSYDNWTPIGTHANPFIGTFSGNGYTIYNLKINNSTQNNVGLFGVINGAEIDDVALVNVDVRGQDRVGGLVGAARGLSKITNSNTSGSVRGRAELGGLVGELSNSTIETSYSISSLINSSSNRVGGLVGLLEDQSTISNSYSTGRVTGFADVGSLVGRAIHSTIVHSYSPAEITGSAGGDHRTGLIGSANNSHSSTATNSYWVHGTGGFYSIGAKKTNEALKQQATFNNWDFDNIWTIQEGISYPTLRNNPEK